MNTALVANTGNITMSISQQGGWLEGRFPQEMTSASGLAWWTRSGRSIRGKVSQKLEIQSEGCPPVSSLSVMFALPWAWQANFQMVFSCPGHLTSGQAPEDEILLETL